jgi:hypothetical protein
MPSAVLWAIVGASSAAAAILALALIGLGAWRHHQGRLEAAGYDQLERAPAPLPRGGGPRHARPRAIQAAPEAPAARVANRVTHDAPLRYVDPPAPRPEGGGLGPWGERYLPTYPGTRMQMFSDGTVEFTDPETGAPVGPWESSPEAAGLRAFIAEIMGYGNDN